MTSFASIEVMPELDDNVEVDIRPEDIKMEAFRASGAGGQHINKTSSAVRLTHIPTGVVTSCQTQRSQHQNRDYAMKMLKAKLVELAEQQQKEKFPTSKANRWITVGAVKSAHMYSSLTLWLKTLEQVLKWVISVRLWTAT